MANGASQKKLSNRERIIRIVGKILTSPAISESPFAPLIHLQRRAIANKLQEMQESEATSIVNGLRDLLK